MRILMVTPDIPWPLERGNRVRIHNFLKELSTRHEVDLLVLPSRADLADIAAADAALRAWCREIVWAPVPDAHRLQRALVKAGFAVRTVLNGMSWQEMIYNLPSVRRAVRARLAAMEYDVVFSAYWYPAWRELSSARVPVVCDTHDVFTERVTREAALEPPGSWRRHVLERQRSRLERQERRVLSALQGLVCVSDKDAFTIRDVLGVKTRSISIAHVRAAQLERVSPAPGCHDVLFFGVMSTDPNLDALRIAVEDVMPLVRERVPDARLVVRGSGIGAKAARLAGPFPWVVVEGPVEQVEHAFRDVALLLLPLRWGSGLKGRVLEAMSVGLPVVGTPIAFEGIPVSDGVHVRVAEGPAALAQAVVELLGDSARASTLADESLDLVAERYTWETTYARIHGFLEDVVARARDLT